MTTRQDPPKGARPIASAETDPAHGNDGVGHASAALTTEALADADAALLAHLMLGHIALDEADGFRWVDHRAAETVAALAWLHRVWRGTWRVESTLRIHGHLVNIGEAMTHPDRAHVVVGLEVPRLETALRMTGCTNPIEVATWATSVLRDYRGAVPPSVDALRALHAKRDVATHALDLADAIRTGDAAGAAAALDHIAKALP